MKQYPESETVTIYELVLPLEIRGHCNPNTPRQFVNTWCDKMSRKYLKSVIK